LALSYPCISAKIACWVVCKNDGNLLLLYLEGSGEGYQIRSFKATKQGA